MVFSEVICNLNAKIEGIFGTFKVKTHQAIQAYNDMNSEYYAEYDNGTQEVEDLVFYDDEFDIFAFIIVRSIDYENLGGYGGRQKVKEKVNAELVIISKVELLAQIQGISEMTKYSKDTYLLNNVFIQILTDEKFIKIKRSIMDIAANERRYMPKNSISIEHRILAIEFYYENTLDLCLNLDCIFNEC